VRGRRRNTGCSLNFQQQYQQQRAPALAVTWLHGPPPSTPSLTRHLSPVTHPSSVTRHPSPARHQERVQRHRPLQPQLLPPRQQPLRDHQGGQGPLLPLPQDDRAGAHPEESVAEDPAEEELHAGAGAGVLGRRLDLAVVAGWCWCLAGRWWAWRRASIQNSSCQTNHHPHPTATQPQPQPTNPTPTETQNRSSTSTSPTGPSFWSTRTSSGSPRSRSTSSACAS
jgi:hypothetical protein